MSTGVAILLSSDIQEQPTNKAEIIPGRMQRVDIDLLKLSLSLIDIYAPNIGTECLQIFDLLNKAISDIPQERIIILAGDFNCILNHSVY